MSRAGRRLSDLSALAAPLAALTAGSLVFGMPTTDYLRFVPVFAVFLLPGWWLSVVLLSARERGDLPLRFSLAFFLSYLLFGWIALGCRLLDGSYEVFLVVFGAGLVGAALAWWRAGEGASLRELASRWQDNFPLVLVIVLALTFMTFPKSEDQGIWDFNMLESLKLHSFAPSSMDLRPHGVELVQPRMQANLFHVFFSLLGWLSDVSPRVLVHYGATPFLGFILLLGPVVYVARICGGSVDRAFVMGAVIAPVTLLFAGRSPYFYEFRLINSPTLDKDFSTFFLLPILLYLAWRYLLEGRRAWLALLLAAIPVITWSHPVAPVYFWIASSGLALAALRRERLARVLVLFAAGFGGVLLCVTAIDPAGTHGFIQDLVARDAVGEARHYFPGHYVQHPDSSLRYASDGWPFLRTDRFFGGGLVVGSLLLTPIWAVIWLVRERGAAARRGRSARLAGAGALVAVGAAGALATGWVEPSPVALAVVAAVACSGLLLVLAAAWWGPDDDGGSESRALRVHAVYVALLTLLYVGATAALSRDVALFRGLERLHWLYFGFFPLVFVPAHCWGALCRSIGRRAPGLLRFAVAVPCALLTLHVVDQAQALNGRRSTLGSRMRLGTSAVDAELVGGHGLWTLYREVASRLRHWEGERGARSALEPPVFLRPDDVVLDLRRTLVSFSLLEGKFALASQAGYYRELYAEAFAYQNLGESFLSDFDAFSAAVDGRISEEVAAWFESRGASLILVHDVGQVRALRRVWPHPIRLAAPGVVRIRETSAAPAVTPSRR